MNEPPGTIPPGSGSQHPRRPPAHKSVSLRHSPPAARIPSKPVIFGPQSTSLSSPNGPASDKANPPSSISPNINSNKQSSGESSDAGKWFENTNNNAHQSSTSFLDNDPPFFLRNSSSSDTPPEAQKGLDAYGYPRAMPYRPVGLEHLGTEGSSTEDFRSVIDDLTIANKKLKQKLKKYEKLYDAHLQDEKLFEVRFHGLPDHKKKELEETLRKFASDLDNTPRNDYPRASYLPAGLDPQKTISSTSRFAESGYASMSLSGQNSSTPSNQPSAHDNDHRKVSKSQYNRQQQSIHSYLHDIPVGLLPKSNVPMSEKSKKKLVVRRLEQIFAGKRQAPGNHPQPMQQEEVAQSAATADRRAKEATGQRFRPEGLREARIMPVRANDEDITAQPESLLKYRPVLSIAEQDLAGSGSPDQRPTRPLDLDPYRAQVPSENMEYIRHLGFTPPDMITGDAPEDGHGWLYLNLLINMAQLHTLNVTPDFVKDAVTEYSGQLELSHDGRKVRWKGGHDVTKNNSDSSSEQFSGNSPFDQPPGSNSKSPTNRLKTHQSGSSESHIDSERKARRAARAQQGKEQNKFTYTPLFFHKDDTDEDDDFYGLEMGSSSNSLLHAQQPGDSSGFGSSAMQSSSSRRRRDDGPIIFYNQAKFCTDLSGDRIGASATSPSSYHALSTHPLGAAALPVPKTSAPQKADISEPRGPMDASPMEVDSKDGGRTSSSEEDLGFSPDALNNDNGTDSPDTMEFQASGLGGVHPDDNFSIRVRRSQTQMQSGTSSGPSTRRKSHLYPRKILEALNECSDAEENTESKVSSPSSEHAVIKEEILSASRKSLPSSTLPPASFLPFDSTSSGDVDSDLESDVSSSASTTSSSDRLQDPAIALQLLNISPMGAGNLVPNGSQSSSTSGEESDDDGSIDMLATARQLDPRTVHASEREYDAALADRLAEEIPAGSSAATAGGGSGFNTPAISQIVVGHDDIDAKLRPNRQSTTSGSMSSRAKLKRSRTTDSLATALKGSGSKASKRGKHGE